LLAFRRQHNLFAEPAVTVTVTSITAFCGAVRLSMVAGLIVALVSPGLVTQPGQ
jgi:hypothetical protein